MKTRKKKITRIKRLFIILFCLAALLLGAILFKSETARFIVKDKITLIGKSVSIEKTSSLEYEEYTVNNLKENEKITFNNSLMLVNTDNKLKDDFKANVKEYKDSDIFLDPCVFDSFESLKNDIKAEYDQDLLVFDDYRTKEEQEQVQKEEGSLAQKVGASEHQTGLSLDVGLNGCAGTAFLNCESGKFVNENCYKYGFIIRYPYFKKSITGISYEPWHIRYVGFPHSEIIWRNGETLEEYLNNLKIDEFYSYDGYIISKQNGENIKLPKKYKSAVISEDNCGNYIVTVKQ